MGSAGSDREAVQAVVGFRPPAVENGEIQAAVQDHLLPAGARGLERTPRIVQPDIDALHEVAADVDVVVLDEDEFVGKLPVAHQLRDLLQHAFAGLVRGCALPAKTNCTGRFGSFTIEASFSISARIRLARL